MIALFNTLKWSAAVGGIALLLLLCKPGLEKRYRAKWRYWLWLALAMFLVLAPVPWSELLPKLSWFQPTVVLELPKTDGKEGSERAEGEPSGTLFGAGVGNAVGHVPSDNLSEAAMDHSAGHAPSGNPSNGGTDDSFVASPSENGKVAIMRVLGVVLPVVWLFGALFFFIWNLCGNLVFSRKLRHCMEAGERTQNMYREISKQMGIARAPKLAVCPQVDSPMVVGLFRPRLLFPGEDYSEQELSFILRHELTHYRRHDLWYKLLLLAANALHWFNPLVYLMVREANRDLELTCDDAVVANEPMEVRRAYSETLFANLGRQQEKRAAYSVFSTYFGGGTETMKARFRNILSDGGRRGGVSVLVLALLVTAVVGCGVRVENQNGSVGGMNSEGQGEALQGLNSAEGNGEIEGNGETDSKDIGKDSEELGTEEKPLLTRSRDDDGKLCLWVCPTEKLLEVGDGGWYYTPEDQAVWLDALEQARARIVKEGEFMPGGSKERGIAIEYQGQYLVLMENRDIITYVKESAVSGYWGRIAADDCIALRGLCEEAAREIGLSEPVEPEQIRGIQKASLHWGDQDYVLADPESLAKLESWLSDSKYLPLGAGCWFTAGLTLELESGRSVTLAMATDSCRTWSSNGVCYDYGGSAYRNGGGGSDNQKFFSLFGIVYTDVDILPANISFFAQYIRTNGYVDGEQYPKTFWITSTEELNDYYNANREQYDFGSKENPLSDQTIGFVDVIRRYDDDFFRERDLVMVVLEEGSGSIRHQVNSVLFTPADSEGAKGTLQPVIERQVPEVGTTDMAEWHIMIEVNKKYGAQNSELVAPIIE